MATRREFLRAIGIAAAGAAGRPVLGAAPSPGRTKPILGSWISILWDDRRHLRWNETCRRWTAAQWALAVDDVAGIGMRYLVLLAIAKGGEAFYDTALLPKAKLECPDPIEALLAAADARGVKFFLSSDWYGAWDGAAISDPARRRARFSMMGEIAARYGRHPSFHGWYWPNEAAIAPCFSEPFIRYANDCTAEARKITPGKRTLIAPYGTHGAVADDRFVRQLEALDVDAIAYQDEVGCRRATPEGSAAAFERLRKAHDKVPARALWADVETFGWEGEPNSRDSPLVPAPFARVKRQLEAVSPYADTVLVYQYQGLMSRPGSGAPAGPPEAEKLYREYAAWLEAEHPEMVRPARKPGDAPPSPPPAPSKAGPKSS